MSRPPRRTVPARIAFTPRGGGPPGGRVAPHPPPSFVRFFSRVPRSDGVGERSGGRTPNRENAGPNALAAGAGARVIGEQPGLLLNRPLPRRSDSGGTFFRPVSQRRVADGAGHRSRLSPGYTRAA